MADDLCVVCRRRKPSRGRVCEPDRTALANLLRDLPRKLTALALQVVPGAAVAGERVATSRVGSPTPARLDALSLAGPGTAEVTAMMHPLIRRWRTEETVFVSTLAGGKKRLEKRTISVWHQELARDTDGHAIEVDDDDQIGVLPPVEWLDKTVRDWRARFGHHVPQRTWYQQPTSPVDQRAQLRRLFVACGGQTPAAATLAYIATTEAAWHNYAVGRVLGMSPRGTRVDDPLADEWEIRFGEPPRYAAAHADLKYLLTWLDEACDQHLDVGAFAQELRALNAELMRVIGEQPDQQWLGRCPTTITINPGEDNETSRPCGAGLWQDAFAAQVMCPRCHCAWGPERVKLLMLAADIRRVWPIDRRRRYHADQVDELRPPHCPGCTSPVTVTWREVTTPEDERRWWRPDKATCPHGCADAGRTL